MNNENERFFKHLKIANPKFDQIKTKLDLIIFEEAYRNLIALRRKLNDLDENALKTLSKYYEFWRKPENLEIRRQIFSNQAIEPKVTLAQKSSTQYSTDDKCEELYNVKGTVRIEDNAPKKALYARGLENRGDVPEHTSIINLATYKYIEGVNIENEEISEYMLTIVGKNGEVISRITFYGNLQEGRLEDDIEYSNFVLEAIETENERQYFIPMRKDISVLPMYIGEISERQKGRGIKLIKQEFRPGDICAMKEIEKARGRTPKREIQEGEDR